jgi:hypothetical protein
MVVLTVSQLKTHVIAFIWDGADGGHDVLKGSLFVGRTSNPADRDSAAVVTRHQEPGSEFVDLLAYN